MERVTGGKVERVRGGEDGENERRGKVERVRGGEDGENEGRGRWTE